MAYEGELVRLENGRWAQFKRVPVGRSGHQERDEMAVLVAVELDEHYQDLLETAEHSLEQYRKRGIPVRIRLDPEGGGKVSVSFDEKAAVQ